MMLIELDPFMASPSRRAALAGLAKLTALDGAERLIALVRDAGHGAADRAQALSHLAQISPTLARATAATLISDSTEAVRLAASSVLEDVRRLSEPEPDPVG